MTRKAKSKYIVWVRRSVQALCLIMFIKLFFDARFHENSVPGTSLKFFFLIDPLVAIATWISTHAIPAGTLLALITLALTLIFGRVFCGWICPLGVIHNMASWLRRKVQKVKPKDEASSKWQRAKYFLLTGLLIMALFGAHWIGIFDPISLLYRSMATAVYPITQFFVEDSANAIYNADPHVGPLHLKSVSEPAYRYLRNDVFATEIRPSFIGSTIIMALFMLIVTLNLVRARFWCRYICPAGALLGLFSKRQSMRIINTENECTKCGRCAVACPGAAQPEKPGEWMPSECFSCWNCVHTCKLDAIDFQFDSPLKKPVGSKFDLSKRALIASGIGGMGGLVLCRMTPEAQADTFNPALIRPPGSREERDFLQRCLQCGLCMKICPTNALHPSTYQAGLEGLWTPVVIPKIGYCEYECNLCTQVCPTEAIEPLMLEEKKKVKIGLATFDTTRCLPYMYDRECMICEEHCPIPTKAIYFKPKEVRLRSGKTVVIKQPLVDPDLCTGCGICENVCVFKDRPAIWVASANETRHPDNQPILPPLDGVIPDYSNVPEDDTTTNESPYGSSSPYGT